MSRKPWLRLVHPRGRGKPEEAEEGSALDELEDPGDSDEHAELAEALRAALGKGDLSEADHEAILARALGEDPASAPATATEAEAAALLGRLLDAPPEAPAGKGGAKGEREARELAELAAALRHAERPAELEASAHESALRRVEGAPASAEPRSEPQLAQRKPRRGGVAALGGLVALAAAVALVARFGPEGAGERPEARMLPAVAQVASRSTEALFDPAEPFPRRGGHAARIDRIASVRTAEFRQNRFAAWGAR